MKFPKFNFNLFTNKKKKLADNFNIIMKKDCRYCTCKNCLKGCSAILLQTKLALLENSGGRSPILEEAIEAINAMPDDFEYAPEDFVETAEDDIEPQQTKEPKTKDKDKAKSKPKQKQQEQKQKQQLDNEEIAKIKSYIEKQENEDNDLSIKFLK